MNVSCNCRYNYSREFDMYSLRYIIIAENFLARITSGLAFEFI